MWEGTSNILPVVGEKRLEASSTNQATYMFQQNWKVVSAYPRMCGAIAKYVNAL